MMRGNRQKTETQEVRTEHEENLIYCAGDEALAQLLREAVMSSPLEIFKIQLDAILGNVV